MKKYLRMLSAAVVIGALKLKLFNSKYIFFQRLLDTLGHDDAEVRRRLSEMTRRITVYRVNEKALTRRYQTMEETDGQLRKVREVKTSILFSNLSHQKSM